MDTAQKSRIYFAVCISAVIAYAFVLEWFWGWDSIIRQWQNWSIASIAFALALLFCTYGLRAYRIRDYFRDYTKVNFSESCRITLMHNLANNLLPMRSGEASFPLMMRSSFGLSLSMTTGTLLFFRALDLYTLLALVSLAWLLGFDTSILWWLIWAIYLCSPILLLQIQSFVSNQVLIRLPQKIEQLGNNLLSGMPDNFPVLFRTLVLTWLNWGLKLLVFAWILNSFGDLQIVQAISGATGGELSSVLPFHAPGGVGTYEAGVVAGAILAGANLDSSVLAAVNLHLIIILGTLIGGLVAAVIRPDSSI